ncbi:MAG TPA: hypothetical protein VGM88_31720 [Kofleriaceae bacterium]|jgi:hypothetical protein
MLQAGGSIRSLAIAGDALVVEVTGVDRYAVRVYDLATGALRRELLEAESLGYFGHGIALRGQTLVTTYRKGFLDELDLATGERLRSIELPGDGGALYAARDAVYVMIEGGVFAWTDGLVKLAGNAFASSPERLVASHDETVVWSAFHGLTRFHRASGVEVPFEEPGATDLASLAAIDRIATIHWDGRLELWTTDHPPVRVEVVQAGFDALHAGRVVPVRGSLVAASTADHRIAIVGPGDVAPRARLAGAWGPITALAVHDDALWIGDSDGRVWREALGDFATPAKKKQKLAMTLAAVRSSVAATRERPWSTPAQHLLVDLATGATAPLPRPSIADVVLADGSSFGVVTTAGRFEWLAR